jgi:hypothetical protein
LTARCAEWESHGLRDPEWAAAAWGRSPRSRSSTKQPGPARLPRSALSPALPGRRRRLLGQCRACAVPDRAAVSPGQDCPGLPTCSPTTRHSSGHPALRDRSRPASQPRPNARLREKPLSAAEARARAPQQRGRRTLRPSLRCGESGGPWAGGAAARDMESAAGRAAPRARGARAAARCGRNGDRPVAPRRHDSGSRRRAHERLGLPAVPRRPGHATHARAPARANVKDAVVVQAKAVRSSYPQGPQVPLPGKIAVKLGEHQPEGHRRALRAVKSSSRSAYRGAVGVSSCLK